MRSRAKDLHGTSRERRWLPQEDKREIPRMPTAVKQEFVDQRGQDLKQRLKISFEARLCRVHCWELLH